MECVLCHTEVTLLDLDVTFAGGPVHDTCRKAYDAELADVLADAEQLIRDAHARHPHRRVV